MSNLETHFAEAGSNADFARRYVSHLSELLAGLDTQAVGRIIETFVDARDRGKVIYFIGNGGSAAMASHFASDLGYGTRAPGFEPFKTISLVDNVAGITALANDEGYDNIFLHQLQGLLQPGDVVVAMSVSGNSVNVVEAVRYANDLGALTIGCTGFDGGQLRKLAAISLHVPTPRGEYGPVEDVFMVLDHLVYSYLRLAQRGNL